MQTTSSFSDYQPIRYIGRVPIHITTILTALFAVGIVVHTLLASSGKIPEFLLGFDRRATMNGAFWQPFTYVFIQGPSFFSLFGLLCFYSWAIEVERYLGRARFAKLFVLLLFLAPIIASISTMLIPGSSMLIAGNYAMSAAFLIAFATLYPNIEYFGWIPLKWFAGACVAIGSLMYFPLQNWPALAILWGECGAAFAFIRFLQRGGSVEFGDLVEKMKPKRGPKLRVLPSPKASARDEEVPDDVDALLDKIARTGMSSLTARERARLEKARERLLDKDQH